MAETRTIIDDFIAAEKIAAKPLNIDGFNAYEISREHLKEILTFVKTSPNLRFTILTDLFGADFPEREKRFEIVYSLLSFKLNTRLLLKVQVAEDETITSIDDIFSCCCWNEREVFDMYGVVFEGAKDMRRILTDYGFVGHPLRKDFPLTGHLQVRYDEKTAKVIYEPVKLDQEFRNFDFLSPWQGPDRLLPGDEKAGK